MEAYVMLMVGVVIFAVSITGIRRLLDRIDHVGGGERDRCRHLSRDAQRSEIRLLGMTTFGYQGGGAAESRGWRGGVGRDSRARERVEP